MNLKWLYLAIFLFMEKLVMKKKIMFLNIEQYQSYSRI